jgi:hypothetical protein
MFIKSKRNNRYISITTNSIAEMREKIPDDATSILIFRSQKNKFFFTFQSNNVKKKNISWDGFNEEWEAYIPKWHSNTDKKEEINRFENNFFEIKWI